MSTTLGRLYRGETDYDFIGNRRKWYAISGLLVIVSVFALSVIRLNLGIDFSGGTSFQLAGATKPIDTDRAAEIVKDIGGIDEEPFVQKVGDDGVRIRTVKIAEELPDDAAALNPSASPNVAPSASASPKASATPKASASAKASTTPTASATPKASATPSASATAPASGVKDPCARTTDATDKAAGADKVCLITSALAEEFGVPREQVSAQSVGANWGRQISQKALQGLFAFLILVTLYISLRFEWKMAVASLAAMVHDLVITAGIYALVGFEVTPSTVIALLTILGYSMYDTIVVFDRVREDTAGISGGSRITYAGATNEAINETVMRSINTSLTSLIPVGALLFVGAGLLKAGTLKDLALALFIGLLASTYSSIFVAAPLLVELKEREPEMKALAKRVQVKGGSTKRVPRAALAGAGGGTVTVSSEEETSAAPAVRPSGRRRRARAGGPAVRAARSGGDVAVRRHRAGRGAHPRRRGLPQARSAVQGHHAPARRPAGLRDRRRRPGRAPGPRHRRQGGRHRGARVHRRGTRGLPPGRGVRAGPQAGEAAVGHLREVVLPRVRRRDARGAL
jgi:preprotein translocase subunit SecF